MFLEYELKLEKAVKMLDDVGMYGAIIFAFLSCLLWWLLGFYAIVVWLVIIAAIYIRNHWFGEHHVENDGDQSLPQRSPHEARKRLNTDNKKYEWDSYDSFNEHWRQRLMSFTVPTNSPAPRMPKRMINPQPVYKRSERTKSRSTTRSPSNKLSPQSSKRPMELPKSPNTNWTSPLKTYNYGPGIYPKVNLTDMQPVLLSNNKSNLTKNRVTVKLSPMQYSPTSSQQTDKKIAAEHTIPDSTKNSIRKRPLKTQHLGESESTKKLRVDSCVSLVPESVLPDHFIENPNTVTEALKRLETVQKVLGTPKTNAIETSYSSMKRYRSKPSIRECIEIEEDEYPKAKILRRDTEISPKSAFKNHDDIIMVDASPIGVVEDKSEMSEDEPEEETTPESVNKQLYVPNLEDHLHDRIRDKQRLQKILEQFSSSKTENDKKVETLKFQSADNVEKTSLTADKIVINVVPPTPEATTKLGNVITSAPTNISTLTSLSTIPLSTVTTSSTVSFDKSPKDNLSSTSFNPTTSGLNITNSGFSLASSALNTTNSGFNPSTSGPNSTISGFNLSNAGTNFQNSTLSSTSSSGLDLASPAANSPTTSASISFLTTTTSTTLSPIHCNGVTATTRVNTISKTSESLANITPVKAVSPFQFGASEQTKSVGSINGVFSFGTSNVTNGVSNGSSFAANTQPSFSFGSPAGGGVSMFSMGSGSTAPRTRLRNRR